jgi:hypothetical protein
MSVAAHVAAFSLASEALGTPGDDWADTWLNT